MTLSTTSLQQFFSQCQQLSKFVVAFSGGLDSTVLLHAMHGLKLPLCAVHINHHLQPESDQWQQHCERICELWSISFSVQHVQLEKMPQKSIEEDARNARYKLLFKSVGAQDALVTAHHKDDLAETLLLQLLRGAGPAGLAAMSIQQNHSLGKQLRPLLEYTRADILAYAQQNSLNWIEDASNDCLDFDRNYLRQEILPRLVNRWPAMQQTLMRAAGLQAEAKQCLEELAKLDLHAAKTKVSHILNIKVLQKLNRARLRNALRSWVHEHGMRAPSKKILDQIVIDIVYKENLETSPVQTWAEGEVRRFREQIYLMKPLSAHDPTLVYRWKINRPLHIDSLNRTLHSSDLDRLGVVLPEGVEEITVRFRCGGERFKPFGEKHHRSLKNLFQEANVPPWERDRIPLLYYHDRLIAVVDHWHAEIHCETL